MSDQNKKTPAKPNADTTVDDKTTSSNPPANDAKKAESSKALDNAKKDVTPNSSTASTPEKSSTPTATEAKSTDKTGNTPEKGAKDKAADEPKTSAQSTDQTDDKAPKPTAAKTEAKTASSNTPAGSQTSTPTQTKKGKPTKEKKGGKFATAVSILALLGVAGVGTYGWLELQKLQGAVAEKVNEQKTLIKQNDPSKKFDAFKQDIGQRFNALNDKQSSFKRELTEVKDAVSASVAERTKDQRDWVIAESEYLIQIANYRLTLLRDVRTATEALKSADRRIGDLNDPAFFPVREALAKEISSLQEVGSFDSSGVALKLMAVSKLVHKLPPALMAVSASQADIDDAAATDEAEKSKVLKKGVMADVARWIGLKENNRPFKALPKQQDVFYLDQLLRLELEAARHAVLRFDKSAYNSHIHTATGLLKEHYDEKNEQVAFVLKELRELKTRNVFPELPDISESSILINKAKTLYKPVETVGE